MTPAPARRSAPRRSPRGAPRRPKRRRPRRAGRRSTLRASARRSRRNSPDPCSAAPNPCLALFNPEPAFPPPSPHSASRGEHSAHFPAALRSRQVASAAAVPESADKIGVDGVDSPKCPNPEHRVSPPPPPRTKWTRLVRPSVLIGHAAPPRLCCARGPRMACACSAAGSLGDSGRS